MRRQVLAQVRAELLGGRSAGGARAVLRDQVGDQLRTAAEVESISARKTTALGQGYFLTWVTTYRTDAGEVVGRQRFRIFKFDPRTIDLAKLGAAR